MWAARQSNQRDTEPLPSRDLFFSLPAEARAKIARDCCEAKISPLGAFRAVLALGRPRTCVPSVLTFALGAGHAGAGLSARTATQAMLCFLGAFVANLENGHTDLEEDCRNLPGRVYVLLGLGRKRLMRVVGGLQLAMLVAAARLDRFNLAFMIVALLIVHQYSFWPLRAKHRPVWGLVVFTCVVTYPFFVGLLGDPHFARARELGLLFSVTNASGDAALRFLCMGAFIAIWFVAKGMFKNVPDYYGDRAAGVRTSATWFSSWTKAALAATVVTVLAYLGLGVPVALRLEPARVGLSLLSLPFVIWNCLRLIRANDAFLGNTYLRTDMLISVAFMSSLLLLAHPTPLSLAACIGGVLVVSCSDWLQVDSRRSQDALAVLRSTRSQ